MLKHHKDWMGKSAIEHIELLEQELEKKVMDDPMLRAHIRQLKFAWRKGRRFILRAA